MRLPDSIRRRCALQGVRWSRRDETLIFLAASAPGVLAVVRIAGSSAEEEGSVGARAVRVARRPLTSLALATAGLAIAAPAMASISDGAVDDNSDPVVVVTCSLVEQLDGTFEEVCFEAHMGDTNEPEPTEPPAEPEPTEPSEPEPTEPEPTDPTEPAEPEPADPSPTAEPSRAPAVLGDSRAREPEATPAAPSETDPDAATTGPTRRTLPQTGPDDVDPRLLALAVGCLAVGGRLVRRALRL